MLLLDDFEDEELKRRRGGAESEAEEDEEEKEEVRLYCACLSRLGLLWSGDFVCEEVGGSGERRWRITKDGQSLSLSIEKTRSQCVLRTSIVDTQNGKAATLRWV